MKYILFKLFLVQILAVCSLYAGANYEHSRAEANSNCASCHDMKEGKEFFHAPVRAGSCNSCHNVFSKKKDLLRVDNIMDICIMCHSDKRRIIEADENVHPPVKQSCINCHDPHAGEHLYRLKADRKKDICLTCHTEKKAWIDSVKNKHGAIDLEDGGCIACHEPHGTSRPKMIKANGTKDLCLKCHNKSLKRQEDGVMLMNIAKHLENNKKWHGPIIVGECTGCHNPHGSNNYRMLKSPYPETTGKEKFSPDKYVCFRCHQVEKFTEAITTTQTNFRKGTKNLHTVHVKTSSITCGTCHDFHGVNKDRPLIKDKGVFFGTKFPLRFVKKPTGGSCNPICHARRHYERANSEPTQ